MKNVLLSERKLHFTQVIQYNKEVHVESKIVISLILITVKIKMVSSLRGEDIKLLKRDRFWYSFILYNKMIE